MEPRIVELDAFDVVGIADNFNTETKSGIPQLWMKFGPRVGEVSHSVGDVTYGICFPGPPDDDRFEYMAAIAVSDTSAIPDGMEVRTVPAQKYAVFTHKIGDKDLHNDLQGTLKYIWQEWLPDSGHAHAPGPDFELYDERFNPAENAGAFDIYIPIKSS
jgi:AraC family transcriptional regulator